MQREDSALSAFSILCTIIEHELEKDVMKATFWSETNADEIGIRSINKLALGGGDAWMALGFAAEALEGVFRIVECSTPFSSRCSSYDGITIP